MLSVRSVGASLSGWGRRSLSSAKKADLALVKQLRELTSAGLMDCKKALLECDNDVEEAARWLRVAGLAKAGRRAGRAAAAGLVGVFRADPATGLALPAGTLTSGDPGIARLPAAMVEVNSETDFAARTDKFVALMGRIGDALSAAALEAAAAGAAAAGGESSGRFSVTAVDESVLAPLREQVAELSGVTGEKMELRRAVLGVPSPAGATVQLFGTYVHQPLTADTRLGSMGSVVGAAVRDQADEAAIARVSAAVPLVAMHVAAMAPAGVDADSLPHEMVVAERAAIEKSVAESGKPAEVQAKVVQGRMKKWIAEVALDEQVYCMAADAKSKESRITEMVRGGKIVAMERFKCGDGIEVETVDFAEEVAREMGTTA